MAWCTKLWSCSRSRVVLHDSQIFWEHLSTRKMGQKLVAFVETMKNLVINFFWTYSLMQFYTICCVSVQIPYLGKIWFLRYRSKCSQPIRLQHFYVSPILRTNRLNFLHVYINSWNFKVYWKCFLWLEMVKNGCGHSCNFDIGCISRMNRWNNLISSMLMQIQES